MQKKATTLISLSRNVERESETEEREGDGEGEEGRVVERKQSEASLNHTDIRCCRV